jgi:RNA polymerase sigma factor (sigma-70 family)
VGVNRRSPDRPSDADTIAASVARPERFAAIFDRHFDALHGYLARRAGAGRAEDLAANTFVIAFERRGTFRAEADSARPWLLGIATNLLRSEWRSEQRALQTLAQLESAASAALSPAGASGHEGLGAALSALDPDQRDVLLLHAWEDLSYEEIARALEIPIGTVRSRLARGRQRLRGELRGDDPALSADQQEVGP